MQKILTQEGTVETHLLQPHHFCFDANGEPNKIISVQKKHLPLYRVELKPQISLVLPQDQPILVDKSSWKWHDNLKSWRGAKLSDLFPKIENKKKWNRFYAEPPPVLNTDREINIHPYVVGVMLGDGCMVHSNFGFSSKDSQIVERMSSILGEGYWVKKKSKSSKYDYSITYPKKRGKNPLKDLFKKYQMHDKGSKQKNIHPDFFFSSYENRVSLLQGLMDTDGTVGKDNYVCSFCTISEGLKNDFVFLCRSLGGTPTVKDKKTFYRKNGKKIYGQPSFDVYGKLPLGVIPFCLDRKKETYMKRFDNKSQKYYRPYLIYEKISDIGSGEWWEVKTEKRSYLDDQFFVIRERV